MKGHTAMTSTPSQHPAASIFTPAFVSLLLTEILSSLGQVTLTFALPLHLLNATGSASLYGIVAALALIPSVILTPVGGAIADRFDKRKAMAALDAASACAALSYALFYSASSMTLITIVTMMLAYGFHALYSPIVQATVPCLVDPKRTSGEGLKRATALITQVNSLTNMIGPVFAGMLLGFAGLKAVVLLSCGACLISSLWIFCFIHIPQLSTHSPMSNPFTSFAADFAQAGKFLLSQRLLLAANIVIAVANLVFCALLNVSLPYIVTHLLGLSNQMQGLTEGAISTGGLAGALLLSLKPKWFTLSHIPHLLGLSSLCLLPTALALFMHAPTITTYAVLTLATAGAMACVQCISVTILAYEQGSTPPQLVGKVIGATMALAMAAMPLGQAVYGMLIDHLPMPAIMLAAAILMALTTLYARPFIDTQDCPKS
ncbi:MFS transporter [Bombiscardovia apis]|uniref:MFS transporter n=1 Tax=Bombiscardovia apis TaxID=2932182 RepID=A0ABM8BCF4_9BIFI|nr:MFS transporter [Bombiscardovia apis]BDR54575.1 MFS transporter [Bombiscardovia apis]